MVFLPLVYTLQPPLPASFNSYCKFGHLGLSSPRHHVLFPSQSKGEVVTFKCKVSFTILSQKT